MRGSTKCWAERIPGGHILQMDYARYGAAEASMGWLNCSFTLHPVVPAHSAMVVGPTAA